MWSEELRIAAEENPHACCADSFNDTIFSKEQYRSSYINICKPIKIIKFF